MKYHLISLFFFQVHFVLWCAGDSVSCYTETAVSLSPSQTSLPLFLPLLPRKNSWCGGWKIYFLISNHHHLLHVRLDYQGSRREVESEKEREREEDLMSWRGTKRVLSPARKSHARIMNWWWWTIIHFIHSSLPSSHFSWCFPSPSSFFSSSLLHLLLLPLLQRRELGLSSSLGIVFLTLALYPFLFLLFFPLLILLEVESGWETLLYFVSVTITIIIISSTSSSCLPSFAIFFTLESRSPSCPWCLYFSSWFCIFLLLFLPSHAFIHCIPGFPAGSSLSFLFFDLPEVLLDSPLTHFLMTLCFMPSLQIFPLFLSFISFSFCFLFSSQSANIAHTQYLSLFNFSFIHTVMNKVQEVAGDRHDEGEKWRDGDCKAPSSLTTSFLCVVPQK